MVVKRNGEREMFSFDKILKRVTCLGKDHLSINYTSLVQKIIDRLYDGIHTSLIDELTAQQCASLITTHYDYGILASRILISNHHKNTSSDYKEVIEKLYQYKDVNGKASPLVNQAFYDIVMEMHEKFQNLLNYERDYLFSYFGFKTLERAYLIRLNEVIVERPQHMWLRVAIAIHGRDFEKVRTTYNYMSQKYFTHATPTLFNAGLQRQQMSSCYLLTMQDDSIEGIYETLTDCAKISKWAGGIGLSCHNIRASGSHIRGTNGTSNGLVPMLRVFNNTARYVDQGGGRRNGSFAIYLEPWHKDIYNFLEMKKNHGDEEQRARDLFYALWIPDLFMERVQEGAEWTLMCPDECQGLSDVYGEAFEMLYTDYEKQGRGQKISARTLWFKILDSQIETGTPYMLYKDACNRKSNQQNLGTIKSSNLCTEIIEYSDDKETAVCNLASVGLPTFLVPKSHNLNNVTIYTKTSCIYCKMAKCLLQTHNIHYTEIYVDDDKLRQQFYQEMSQKYSRDVHNVPQIMIDTDLLSYQELRNRLTPEFDYNHLHKVTKIITENLDKIIDVNFYPIEKTRQSNYLHRPIGIGVQGLADVFALMDLPFDSEDARHINRNIFETIYHAALEKSNELAQERHSDMLFLASHYESWRPQTERDVSYLISRDYELVFPPCKIKDKIHQLIQTRLPIPAEIEKLPHAHKGAYSSFTDSPASQGLLQFDLWEEEASARYDWRRLKNNIAQYGLRNSLLVAPMPTASTSQILGNNECFEPYTSNIYVRRATAGEFIVVNQHLLKELIGLGKWDVDIKNSIIAHNGSIQHLDLPTCIKEKYKTVWEIPMRNIIDMAKDRAIFIDQSQSMNLWMETPTYDKLTAMHFHSWNSGLKTGLYYLRTRAKAAPQQFTIDPTFHKPAGPEDGPCELCSS